jgi:hypothetical protein
VQEAGRAEVDELDTWDLKVRNHDVLRLEIAVDEAKAVEERERREYLHTTVIC